jgi:cell division protein FtsW (lipid II flippase)
MAKRSNSFHNLSQVKKSDFNTPIWANRGNIDKPLIVNHLGILALIPALDLLWQTDCGRISVFGVLAGSMCGLVRTPQGCGICIGLFL